MAVERDAAVGSLRPGDPVEVDGHRLLGRLGEGGQGRVFLAEGPDGERVALKVLLPEVASDPVTRERIAAQLDLTRHLPDAAVVPLFAARVDAEPPYLVSEYVAGPSLADRVQESGPLAGQALDRLMTDALDALAAIHRAGVVHNDLKPANILLGPDGPRVADFDLALRIGTPDPLANEDGVMGSAAFLAPERLDAGPAIRASDVFAWAATMVYAGTGRSPFHAADLPGVVRAIEHEAPKLAGMPERTQPFLQACLAKDPLRRPTVDAAADRLAAALQAAPPAVSPAVSLAGSSTAAPTSPPSTSPGSGVPAWGTPSSPGVRVVASPTTAQQQSSSAGGIVAGAVFGLMFLLVVLTLGFVDGASGSGSEESGAGPVEPAPTVPAPSGGLGALAVRDDTLLRLVLADGEVRRWLITDWSRTPAEPDRMPLVGIAASPIDGLLSADGSRVAVVGRSSAAAGEPSPLELTVWDSDSGTVLDARPWPAGPEEKGPTLAHAELALSSDGAVVAVLATPDDGTPGPGELLVRRTDGTGADLPLAVPDPVPGTLVVSPDGRWLAYRHRASGATPAGWTRVVDLGSPGSPGADLPGHCDGPVGFAPGALPDRPVVLCPLPSGGLARLTPDGASAGRTLATHCGLGRPPVVSPDGTAVACLGDTVQPDGGSRPAVWLASLRSAEQPAVVRALDGQLGLPSDVLGWDTGGDHVVVGSADVPFGAVAWSG